jgi:hypothetical protein
LERARRRRDKFVRGPIVPPVVKRQPRVAGARPEPSPVPPVIQIYDPNEKIIADELIHGDGKGDVLFEESEFYGEFHFRDSILEQLDRYWVYLRRMKKHDPDSYQMYKALGATIIPYSATGANREHTPIHKMTTQEIDECRANIKLSPWFIKTRPAFGCVAVGTDPLTEKEEQEGVIGGDDKQWLIIPKFVYFVKYRQPPPEIQLMSGGDIYKMTIWWDRPFDVNHKDKYGVPTDVCVFVSQDGQHIQILRTLDTKMVKIRSKKNGLNYDLIPQRAWRIPSNYVKWAKDHGLDAQTHLAHIFCGMTKKFEYSNLSMIRVNVYKDNLCAVFGVNPRRLPYFFQDRNVQIDQHGSKKRIFHYVKSHQRSDGALIKEHFRGLRQFDWAGYRVLITIPGRDHLLFPEISLGLSDEYWMKDKKDVIYEGQFGEALAKNVQGRNLEQALEEVSHYKRHRK